MRFPENLLRAHSESERLRNESIAGIEGSKNLSFHAEAIERTSNLLYFLGHDGDIKSDDDRNWQTSKVPMRGSRVQVRWLPLRFQLGARTCIEVGL